MSYSDIFLLTREDIITSMKPGCQILSNLIECWSLLVNDITAAKQAPLNPSRSFFGLSHSVRFLLMFFLVFVLMASLVKLIILFECSSKF